MKITENLLPLEKYLQHKSLEGGVFPVRGRNYFHQYYSLKECLTPMYKTVDVNACFIDGNYYTHHGVGHVDDVILYAGRLLGIDASWKPSDNVNPLDNDYSIFVLLVSILLHDVGMYYGREDHEKRCFLVLQEHKNLFDADMVEIKDISEIAKAHSGRFNDSKDTLSNAALRTDNDQLGCGYNSKELAALVRFADEICETKQRASKFAITGGAVCGKSLICHKYCSYINSVKISPERDEVTIEYTIPKCDVEAPIVVGDNGIFMIDEIADRLDKINKERVYCNRFFLRRLYVKKITARINIVDDNLDTVVSRRLHLEDRGYPDEIVSIKKLYPDFSGAEYKSKNEMTLSAGPGVCELAGEG